jgi:hypothetical protein
MDKNSMTQTQKVALGIGVLVIVGLIVWGVINSTSPTTTDNGSVTGSSTNTGNTNTGSTTGNGNGTGASNPSTGSSPLVNTPPGEAAKVETYNNATYNFTISYPIELNAGSFSSFHLINGNNWRVGATAAKRGTAVVAVPVFRVDNQAANKKNYPLYYGTEVRVGVSNDTAQCYATDDGYTQQTVTSVTINGVTFKKFIFSDAAMMQYLNGASYRTIHNNKCYVIEQVRNGSSYRDETIIGGYADADLDAFYARTTPIVMSFKFTK